MGWLKKMEMYHIMVLRVGRWPNPGIIKARLFPQDCGILGCLLATTGPEVVIWQGTWHLLVYFFSSGFYWFQPVTSLSFLSVWMSFSYKELTINTHLDRVGTHLNWNNLIRRSYVQWSYEEECIQFKNMFLVVWTALNHFSDWRKIR